MPATLSTFLSSNIREYYNTHPQCEQKYQNIIHGKAPFSLRDIDWFVTHMASRSNEVFIYKGKIIDVGLEYKDALRSYSKHKFDSFKRKASSEQCMCLEDKQRNFFRWAFEKKIVDYVELHLKDIKDDMAQNMSSSFSSSEPSLKRRRRRKCHKPMVVSVVSVKKTLVIPKFYNIC